MLTVKLIFLSKHARPDILTAVAFLTTRVESPTKSDEAKLTRVTCYLQFTPLLNLALKLYKTKVIKWRADGSFTVHLDMKSHTGGTMIMGKGAVYSSSTRQKLNLFFLTEAELVTEENVLHQILWKKCFLDKQGYDVKGSILYQDNLSAMLLKENGNLIRVNDGRHEVFFNRTIKLLHC